MIFLQAIVWEKELSGTFRMVGNYPFLQSHGVTEMFVLDENNVNHPKYQDTSIIFITKPNTSSMDLVYEYIRRYAINILRLFFWIMDIKILNHGPWASSNYLMHPSKIKNIHISFPHGFVIFFAFLMDKEEIF